MWRDATLLMWSAAEKIKIGLDNFFGPSWHAVVGEEFSFNIDYEGGKVYYIVYGSHAILVWKVSLHKAKEYERGRHIFVTPLKLYARIAHNDFNYNWLLKLFPSSIHPVRHCSSDWRKSHWWSFDEGEAEGDDPEEESTLRWASWGWCIEVEQITSHERIFCRPNLNWNFCQKQESIF